MSDNVSASECGSLKGAQRHLHANEPVCEKCRGYLDALIADMLSTTQHGTEAGYHRHMRDARRRKEWDRVWSPEDGVLTQRYYKKGEHAEYTGWVPGFLWPPVDECPHIPSCREAHAKYVQEHPREPILLRSEREELEKERTSKREFGMCRPGEVPAVDSVLRKEWRRFSKQCSVEASLIIPKIAECLAGVKATKLKATLNERAYHVPIPPVSDELSAVIDGFDELVGGLPSTKLPLRAVLAHRAAEQGLVSFDGKEWTGTDVTEDIFG